VEEEEKELDVIEVAGSQEEEEEKEPQAWRRSLIEVAGSHEEEAARPGCQLDGGGSGDSVPPAAAGIRRRWRLPKLPRDKTQLLAIKDVTGWLVEEVTRIMQADERDWFHVLGVPRDVEDAARVTRCRTLLLALHPDKRPQLPRPSVAAAGGDERLNHAFGRVRAAQLLAQADPGCQPEDDAADFSDFSDPNYWCPRDESSPSPW
jgi:hypothetical protein